MSSEDANDQATNPSEKEITTTETKPEEAGLLAEGTTSDATTQPDGETTEAGADAGSGAETSEAEEKHEYDLVILGTGIKECILSGLCSIKGLKILTVDDNSYYGSESASLNLENLYEKFKPKQADGSPAQVPSHYHRPASWNVDLAPKLLLGSGSLIQMLLQTRVTNYLEIVVVKGSFVFKEGKPHKVPVTAEEALKSSLVGFFQKYRLRTFLEWVNSYDLTDDNAKANKAFNAKTNTSRAAFENFSLADDTYLFVGHAIAGYNEDSYLDRPAIEMVERSKLYANAVAQFQSSPFLYTRYGLGGVPEGFARLSAIHGGTQMLNRKVTAFKKDPETGKVCGLTVVDNATGETIEVKTKAVLAEPRFFTKKTGEASEGKEDQSGKIQVKERIVRSINILKHPLENTENRDSLQIIIPGHSIGRKNDQYITLLSAQECVCSKGYYIACASTVVEGPNNGANVSDAEAERQLQPAFNLMGQVEERFTYTTSRYVAADDGTKDNIFVTSSLDATCTFDNEANEVIQIYPRITGEKLDLSKRLVPEISDH